MGSRHPGESGLRGAQGEEGKWAKSGRGRGRDRDAYLFDRIYRMDRIPVGESSHTEAQRAQWGNWKEEDNNEFREWREKGTRGGPRGGVGGNRAALFTPTRRGFSPWVKDSNLAALRPHAAQLAAHVQHSRPANGLPVRASPDRQGPGGTRAKRGPKPNVKGVFGKVSVNVNRDF